MRKRWHFHEKSNIHLKKSYICFEKFNMFLKKFNIHFVHFKKIKQHSKKLYTPTTALIWEIFNIVHFVHSTWYNRSVRSIHFASLRSFKNRISYTTLHCVRFVRSRAIACYACSMAMHDGIARFAPLMAPWACCLRQLASEAGWAHGPGPQLAASRRAVMA